MSLLIQRRTWRLLSAIILPTAVYGLLATWRLDWPAPYYDEMLFVNAALGGHDNTFITTRWLGAPIFLMHYIGALKAWLCMPVFACLGVSVWTVRLPAIVLGGASIGLTYAWMSRLFSPRAGRWAAWLTAVEPGFLFQTRWDWGPTAVMMLAKSVLFLGIVSWMRTGSRRAWWAAVAAAIAGTFDKSNFIWIVIAAASAALAVEPGHAWRFIKRNPLTVLSAMLLWIASSAAIWVQARAAYPIAEELAVADWGRRSAEVLSLLRDTLGGAGAYAFIIGDPGAIPTIQLLALLTSSLAVCVGLVLGPRVMSHGRSLLFVVIVGVVLLGEIFVTRRATGVHHMIMLSPLWLVLIAGVAAAPLESTRARGSPQADGAAGSRGGILCRAGLAFLLLCSLGVDMAYLRQADRPVANVNWDPGSYALVQYAETHPELRYISIDWGIHTVLQGLTQGRTRCLDLWATFMTPADRQTAEWIESSFVTPDTVFVLRAPDAENFPETRSNFVQLARDRGWTLDPVAQFPRGDGRPLLELYRASRSAVGSDSSGIGAGVQPQPVKPGRWP